jgi:hypothetical protein
MAADDATHISLLLPRSEFLSFGKTLKKGFHRQMIGEVTFVFEPGKLTVSSEAGGTTMQCETRFTGTIFIKEVGFRSLVNAHAKEITANPWINGIIDLELGELSLARAGVKARIVV